MIGLVTAEARAEMEKRRKRSQREDRERMPGSDAHHAAEGAIGHLMGDHDEEDCEPVMEPGESVKAYEERGITDGPGDPVMPGQISPQDFGRPYIQDGHGAPSPGYQGPTVPHVDLRGDRGQARPLNPFSPTLPVEGPR